MKKTLLSAASSIGIVTAALLFTGCGDSDSSSSSSSTAGTQTGQFVKGAWKGIGYTRSNGVSGTTGVNGTFTYNLGENVTFDFGLGTAIWESGSTTGNSANPAAAVITSCVNPKTNAPWNITDAAKVSAIFSAYNVSENDTADLSTFVSSLKPKVGTVFNISNQTIASLDTIVANIGNITGGTITNATAATGGYGTALNSLVDILKSVTAASLPAGYNLNATNKKLVLQNGTVLSNLTTYGNTTVNYGGQNYSVLGKLTGGVSLVNNAGDSLVAKVVAYDLSTLPPLSNVSVSVNGKNNTYTFAANNTYTLKVDNVASVGGTWNKTTDNLGINLYPSNTTTGGANSTVTFEDAPTTSGAIAKIWEVVSNLSTTLKEVVYSVVSKVL